MVGSNQYKAPYGSAAVVQEIVADTVLFPLCFATASSSPGLSFVFPPAIPERPIFWCHKNNNTLEFVTVFPLSLLSTWYPASCSLCLFSVTSDFSCSFSF